MTKVPRLFGCAAFIFVVVAAAHARDPAASPDGTWISLSGMIASAADDAFILDYGTGAITVEMDGWEWYDEGERLQPLIGKRVVIHGHVDDGFHEAATIEAQSVFVPSLNTHFYASDADEEDMSFAYANAPHVVPTVTLSGVVTRTAGREFVLDKGVNSIQVDTSEMAYNPMDAVGYQRVKVGDRVRVTGTMDYEVVERRELKAETIVTLARDKSKRGR